MKPGDVYKDIYGNFILIIGKSYCEEACFNVVDILELRNCAKSYYSPDYIRINFRKVS